MEYTKPLAISTSKAVSDGIPDECWALMITMALFGVYVEYLPGGEVLILIANSFISQGSRATLASNGPMDIDGSRLKSLAGSCN